MDLKTTLQVIAKADLSEMPEEGFEAYQFAQWYQRRSNLLVHGDVGVLITIDTLATFPSGKLDQMYAQFLLEREET